jgi:hypothetical protein
MTSSSLFLYHGGRRKWRAMGARAYVLLDIVDGKSEQVAKALQVKPGVMIADLLEGPPDVMVVLEAFERLTLAELTIQALTSVETAIKSVHSLPTQDGE